MAEDTEIRQLDDRTVRRIAAGEVVERPASVVKELVENSLDADAGRIDVSVEAGGTDRIAVRDDGIGMTEADVRAAVREHTTSKIDDIADLEAGVSTLGFRGEALHTIGAVSRVTIRTKPRGADGAGTELRMEGGAVEEVSPAGCPEGTVVEVADLFFNTPARKKYLKTEPTEFSHVNTVVTRYALANPGVAVSLEHDDREVFGTPGRGDLQEALLAVYGREVAEGMVAVERDGDVAVSGYVSDPETTRSTREYMSTFVNGRAVDSATVRDAVLDAYGGHLATDRYPFAVLFLDLPGGSVDVNVHPRKMEVRFDDPDAVSEAVNGAVEDALLDHGLVRSSAPRGRSAPDETAVSPGEQSELGAGGTGSAADEPDPGVASGGERDRQPTDGDGRSASGDGRASRQTGNRTTDSRSGTGSKGGTSTGRSTEPEADDRRPTGDSEPDRKFDAPTESATLGEAEEATFESLPRMRLLGQLHDTYLVAETPDGLVLVDQHAADERINYERLSEAFADDTTSQVLAEPVELELTAREAAVFDEYRDALASLGFHAGRDGQSRTVTVRTVPTVLDETLDPELLCDALGEFVSTDPDERGGDSVEAVADALLADLACYPSITGNTSLREGSVVELLSALDGCKNPYACPHGRPTVVQLSEREIADRFERDYPGHGERREE